MHPITNHIHQALRNLYPPEEVRALARIICVDMLGIRAIDLYVGKDITLLPSQQAELDETLSRLAKYEPIQYIRGIEEFRGRPFRVNPHVLIPRPETAELVDLIIADNARQPCRILDIGTGSGCIAITLDLEMPEATVDAWEVSGHALAVAIDNNADLGAHVGFALRDMFDEEAVHTQAPYHVIVSNPPYVTETELAAADPNIRWEPRLALHVPDDNPLLYYRRIARIGRSLLADGGRLYFEINQAYGQRMARMLEGEGYAHIRLVRDTYGNERFVVATPFTYIYA
ncbi:MAG: peptide chain release factor N(5)-glutamine methyltransferase [Mediterranea sp.]|jgi:release factor glutamine methyltransferase|nr:peptide chain release factor N(5)-glutamine methyltransferase [Mediterranea sp.]